MAKAERADEATVHFLVPARMDEPGLPTRLTSFIGRQDHVAGLAQQLTQSRLVTVTGPGGVGKSRLALEGLERLGRRVVWIELGPIADSRQVATAVATSLGLRREGGRRLVDTLGQQLKNQELVLALDNVEHLVAEVAGLVDALLRAAPKLGVLTTSREPLQVEGEVIWRLPPLPADDAVQLFAARAAHVVPGYDPSERVRDDIAALCQRLDGLPLAIELAAARLRVMTVAQLISSLDDRFGLLAGNARNVLAQQRTLEASMAWSYDLLDESAKSLLRGVSVFTGDFSTEAAGDADVLVQLVDRSLVQVVEVEPRRFRLLETVRDFSRIRLDEAGDSDAAHTRHAQFFLDLAEHTAPKLIGGEAIAWLSRLDAERHELEAALRWWHEVDLQRFRRMVVALGLFWELRYPASGVRWLRIAVQNDGDDSVLWAQVLWQSAHMGVYGDDLAATQRRAPEAVAAAERAGDPRTIARARTTATYCTAQHHPPTARAALAESVQMCRDSNDAWGVGDALKMETIACLTMGDDQGLAAAMTALRAAAGALGNEFFVAWCDALEGYVAVQHGDTGRARQRLTAAAMTCQQIGDPLTGWLTTTWLADLQALVGERDSARHLYAETMARAGASGGSLSTVGALVGMARLIREDGDLVAATELLAPIAEVMQLADPLWRSMFATEYGRCLGLGGKSWLIGALHAAEEIQNPGLLAAAHHGLGELAVLRDDPPAAEAAHHRALGLRVQAGLVPGILDSLHALALLRDSEPLLLATATERAARGLSCSAPPVVGPVMTLDEAVAYATRSRGSRKRPTHGWASLTPTEHEVVRLVAEGLSNNEIGERMFIGRGTVKTHLSHVFTKLEVSTRSALAAEVTRQLP
ncbi:MAG: LuxR C-terminal-related transcriptional regulator [Mycobacteriales bacterium]